MRLRIALPVAALLLAGCASPDSAVVTDQPLATGEGAAAPAAGFRLEGADCVEGGGHSVHPKWDDYLPDPWEPADVLPDVGPQARYSEVPSLRHPTPTKNETMGNYHATVVCASWALDGEEKPGLVLGFVGMKVEPPPFDAGAPAALRHYLVTVVATNDAALRDRLHAGGVHASDTSGFARWEGPVFHNVLDTSDHGVYEAVFRSKDMGAMEAGVVRLWWQRENADGSFSPVAIDLSHGVGGEHLAAEPEGYFSHLRTEDHAPLPGAAGGTAGLAFRGFDRVVEWGPRPAVNLTEAYIHA